MSKQKDVKKMRDGVRLLLQGMGADLKDSNYKGTPDRVAKLFSELLSPQANNWASFPTPTSGMIVLRGHKVFALCPHHLQVVELRAYVAYIPRKRVLGLSKLARVVEQQLTEPRLQEELGELVVTSLEEQLEPWGSACILAGQHGCMRHRGVMTDGDVVTSALRGYFKDSAETRHELNSIIGRP